MKAVVLNSGGVDSTTCVAIAMDEHGRENVHTVSVYYGQKHKKELECSQKIAERYGVPHDVLDLSEIFRKCSCPLIASSGNAVPEGSYGEQLAQGSIKTYVPFRNGLMLSAVASFAMSLYPNDDIVLYLGNHEDDATGDAYPDCSKEFTDAISEAIFRGTAGRVSLRTPFTGKYKKDVVAWGLKLGVPYELTWSCYNGGEKACGKCGTCIDRREAFRLNGVEDPIDYEGEKNV